MIYDSLYDSSQYLSPYFGNPVAFLFKLLQFSSQLSEHRGQIGVDDDLLEQVAVIILHILCGVNHLLEVCLL